MDWNQYSNDNKKRASRRIFYRCVDWNSWKDLTCAPVIESHLLQMRGLKPYKLMDKALEQGRIFYRCVDWNLFATTSRHYQRSRIFYRCVDWNWQWFLYHIQYIWSHLLQMRGLKLTSATTFTPESSRIFYRCVDWNLYTSYAVWRGYVASFTDAWIETLVCCHDKTGTWMSHLLQMRGLKQDTCQISPFDWGVASFTDAWIETYLWSKE